MRMCACVPLCYVHRYACMCVVLTFKSVLNAIQYLKTDYPIIDYYGAEGSFRM